MGDEVSTPPMATAVIDQSTKGGPGAPPEARATETPGPLTPALERPIDFMFDAVHATATVSH